MAGSGQGDEMAIDGLSDAAVRAVLTGVRRVAVVGASGNPGRPSFGVMGFLLRQGFDVTPVNPGLAGQSVQGRVVVAALGEAAPLEMVDVFRASDHVAPVMEAAIAGGARVVWMQLGVVDAASAARGRAAGLMVLMDRCPAIEWRRLGLG